jgi:anti-sigma factor RsiW
MSKPSDERLIAYLDGELGEDERAEIAHLLEQDAELRERAAQFSESAALLRAAFDETLHEPVPERLLAAARGEAAAAAVVEIAAARQRRWRRVMGDRRWWAGMAAAASLGGLLIGGGLGYFAGSDPQLHGGVQPVANTEPPPGTFVETIAGYHKLYVNAGPDDSARFDVPAGQKLPQDFHVPNLKPWGLTFQGVRFLFVAGQPATQFFYTTDNKALGPITLVIAKTKDADLTAQNDKSGDITVLRWRHSGHAYALAGSADLGYLWNLHNDIAYQLDAI